jgi:hypothetical protein
VPLLPRLTQFLDAGGQLRDFDAQLVDVAL